MAIISGINAGNSEGGGGVSPDYIPPNIKYKDADEIYVQKGRYNKAGYRFEGQYQDLANITDYWDVETMFTIAVDNTYSAGTLSGTLGGLVNSSWYSVFMVASDEIVVLPFIRVDAIAYSAPSTTINPASHADGTTAENGWVTTNDIFNNYRLLLINDDPTESGNVYTIADCATGTPDTIVIAGDITADVAATEWLQMIPPAATPCLYLGEVRIDSSGNLDNFDRTGKTYRPMVPIAINLNKALSSSLANTELATAIPPTAKTIVAQVALAEWNATCRGVIARFYSGSSGSNAIGALKWFTTTDLAAVDYVAVGTFPITNPAIIRNHAAYRNNSNAETAIPADNVASIQVNSFDS